MSRRGLLVVISGPSGSGKDTVVNELFKARPELKKTVSATTRPMRDGEADRVSYYFMSEDEFDETVRRGGFLETVSYNGNRYGTLISEIEKKLSEGSIVVLVIDVSGAAAVKKAYPDSLTIFNSPPSMEVLEQRLRRRHTESEESIRRRLETAKIEMSRKDEFDYVLINDDLDRAVTELMSVIDDHLAGKE